MSVMRSPPDRSLLSGCCSEERQDELKPTTSLVASVREVSVIDSRDAEHPYRVEGHAYSERGPAEPRPEHQEAAEMDSPKGRLFYQVYWVKWIAARAHV